MFVVYSHRMTTNDFSRRTSPIYDDREGTVVRSLTGPMIRVCEGPAPRSTFFLVPTHVGQEDGVPSINLQVEHYVRVSGFSEELRAQIRAELKRTSDLTAVESHALDKAD